MPTLTLDANVVRTATCPADKSRVDFYDTAIPGFVLEVRASGGKTYYLRYRDAHTKQRQQKVGDAKSLSFEQARSAAQTLRARVVLGESPAEQKAAKRSVPTVAQLSVRYLSYVKTYKRSWDADERHLRNHLLPKFGKKHLDEIEPGEVVTWLHALRAKGYAPASVNRLLIIFRYMLNLARRWGVPGAEKNPLSGVALLEANNARERYLSPEETQKLRWALTGSDNPQLAHIVALLLLLGCRKRELLDAQWSDFDLDRRSWRIPMSKSGKARHVPLSEGTLAVLAQLPRWKDCPYVVPNPKSKKPYVTVFHSWDTARKQAGLPDVRMHDLRHSFASYLVNAGRSLYEVQKILGHAQLKTTQRYAHLSQETLLEAASAAADAVGAAWTDPVTRENAAFASA